MNSNCWKNIKILQAKTDLKTKNIIIDAKETSPISSRQKSNSPLRQSAKPLTSTTSEMQQPFAKRNGSRNGIPKQQILKINDKSYLIKANRPFQLDQTLDE